MENRISVRSVCSCLISGVGRIQESARTPERNQQEVTEATERQLPLQLRFLCWLLLILQPLAWFAVKRSLPKPPRPKKGVNRSKRRSRRQRTESLFSPFAPVQLPDRGRFRNRCERR